MSLRELQLFALGILEDVHAFCNKNNINYSLYGGTLLGAIRHHGFIPWDDDIDIIMPREDYNRFCSIYHSEQFVLVNRTTDSSFQLAYTRVCDIKNTLYHAVEPCSNKPTGVWIDVFPADGCPANEKDVPAFYEQNRFLFCMTEKVRMSMASISDIWKISYNKNGLLKTIKWLGSVLFHKMYYSISGEKESWINRLIELNTKYSFQDSKFWASLSCVYPHLVYHPKEDFAKCELIQFEDSKFYAMNGADNYLRRVYGNYMELPPKEKQVPPLGDWYKFYWL